MYYSTDRIRWLDDTIRTRYRIRTSIDESIFLLILIKEQATLRQYNLIFYPFLTHPVKQIPYLKAEFDLYIFVFRSMFFFYQWFKRIAKSTILNRKVL